MRSVNWYQVSGLTLVAALVSAAFGQNEMARYFAVMSVVYGLFEAMVRP